MRTAQASREDDARAQQEIQAHIDALTTARDEAVQTFTGAAAAIAESLRAYGDLWRAAARTSMRHSRNNATSTQWFGHADLEPATSRLNPRHLKEALGRVLAAAGVNPTGVEMRAGLLQRRAATQRNRGGK